jgi:hypothetical protein
MAGIILKYFILRPRYKYEDDLHAKASCIAMRAYAAVIGKENKKLSSDLVAWVDKEEKIREERLKTGEI